MPEEPKHPSGRPLTTWKEVAAFFERDVRTVQRWEREEGLPVHRHVHHRKSSVYADTEELRAWWEQHGKVLNCQQEADATQATPAATLPLPSRRTLTAGALVFAALVIAVAAWITLRPSGKAQSTTPAAFIVQTIALPFPDSGELFDGRLGDLNGDGYEDLVLSAYNAHNIYIFLSAHTGPGEARFADEPSVVIRLPQNSSALVDRVGDFNGDGIKDLLISGGIPQPEAFHTGDLLFLIWGRRAWPRELILPGAADVVAQIAKPGEAASRGCDPRGKGDLNGDGIEDLVLGALEYSPLGRRSAGGVFVHWGRERWPHTLETQSAADFTIHGARMGEGLHQSCALGDFNGDGRTDLATAASEHTIWNLQESRGRVYVFLARTQWPAVLDAQNGFDFRVDGVRPNAFVEPPLLADLNGDGRDDLIIARPRQTGAPTYSGEVAVWFGGENHKGVAAEPNADVVISGDSPAAEFGSSLAAFDFNSDGMKDLIVSSPGRGRINVLYGRRDWRKNGTVQDFQPVLLFEGELGIALAGIFLGDINADHLPEVLFTSALKTHDRWGKKSSGRAWIVSPYRAVQVEIRPDLDPNVVYFPGLVVARMYGFSTAAGDQLDPASVRMAGVAPHQHVTKDYNGDGIPDLQLYFETEKMSLTANTKRIALTGRTRSGQLLGGSDTVEIIMQAPGEARKGQNRVSRR
jgi:hypothetical protein